MKQALFLVDEYPRITSTGGQGDWTKIITGVMRELDFEVHVITGAKGAGFEEDFVHVTRIPQRKRGDMFTIFKAVRQAKPDLIHAAAIYPPYYFASWIHPRAAKVLTSHGPPLMKDQPLVAKTNIFAHWTWYVVAPLYNRIICSTPFEYNLYMKRLSRLGLKKMAETKLRQISFPIDVDFYLKQQNRKALKKKFGLEGAEFVVSEVAVFLHKHKDQLTAARAVRFLIDKGVKAKLLLSGIDPRPDQAYKKQIIETIGEDNVVFTGNISKEKLRDVYWVADAYVSPGYDTQGLCPREAFAAQRPLFLSDIVFYKSGFGRFAKYHERWNHVQLGGQLYECFKTPPAIDVAARRTELERFTINHFREGMRKAFVESLGEKGFEERV